MRRKEKPGAEIRNASAHGGGLFGKSLRPERERGGPGKETLSKGSRERKRREPVEAPYS